MICRIYLNEVLDEPPPLPLLVLLSYLEFTLTAELLRNDAASCSLWSTSVVFTSIQ